ncbi:MAG: CapA family protein [Chloroflexi bacterium]|nr:CapA family protein [Chloroflexota bacterium]
MLGRLMNETLQQLGPPHPWGDTLPLLRAADLRLINLECVIAESGRPWTRTPKAFHFRADPIAMETLRLAGIDCVSLANNHVLDYEEAAFREMLRRLDEAGIARAGAGENLAEAIRPSILQARGLRVAVVAFTDNQPEWAATPSGPGVHFVRVSPDDLDATTLAQAIGSARDWADVVICSAHWGPNMRQRPPRTFRDFARRLIERGVDLFYGHSAHVFQGIEVYRGKPILHDTGDFVDDYAVDPALRNDRSFLFTLTLDRSGVVAIDFTPVLIAHRQVNRAAGDDSRDACRTMLQLSMELGTPLEERPGGLRLALR